MATQEFEHVSEWQIVVCKQCRYAVWPSQIEGHLRNKQHHMPGKQAAILSEEVEQWPGVARFPGEITVPHYVERAIPGIAVWNDGWKCEWDGGECTYVCRRIGVMKKHWRQSHAFSVGQKRGGSGLGKKEDVEYQTSQRCRRVQCQRIFVQKEHSQYFEVRSGRDHGSGASDSESDDGQAWSQAWERASQCYSAIRADDTIRSGAVDEVNPWLRRTGWVPFMEGCNR